MVLLISGKCTYDCLLNLQLNSPQKLITGKGYVKFTYLPKAQVQDPKPSPISPLKFIKTEVTKASDCLPPRAAPFKRSRNTSRDRPDRENSQCRSSHTNDHQLRCREHLSKIAHLQKRALLDSMQRQKLSQSLQASEFKNRRLEQQINKLRLQKMQLETKGGELKQQLEESQQILQKSQTNADQLARQLKEARINQKSLNNLKMLQNQIEYLQDKNKKLSVEVEELTKDNKKLQAEMQKTFRESTSDSDHNQKEDRTVALQMEVRRLKDELGRNRNEREKMLQNNLQQLEKKLYEKTNQLKSLQIQMNCIDRKKTFSIDEVKTKKDLEIKDLRLKLIKTSRDLKETKEKIEKTQKKRNPKESAFLRKVKSNKGIGLTSQSEVTFELSSDA